MQHVGHKVLPLSALEGWQEHTDDETAQRIARRRDRIVKQPPPIVREHDLRLMTGRRTLAALHLAGFEEVEVKLYDATDAECDSLERAENVGLRHTPLEQRAAIVRMIDEAQASLPPIIRTPGKVGPGRPRNNRSRARAIVAQELGISEQQIRRHDKRAKKRKEPRQPRPVLEQTYGIELTPEYLREIEAVGQWLSAAETRLRGAQAALTRMLSEKLPVHEQKVAEVRTYANKLATALRALKPRSLCPYCKGQEGLQEKCPHCEGRAWVGSLKAVPAPLLDPKDLHVWKDGAIIPIETLEPSDD